jgi:hypothetical protein
MDIIADSLALMISPPSVTPADINIIPLVTPAVTKIEGYEGNASRSETNGISMWKSYDYDP